MSDDYVQMLNKEEEVPLCLWCNKPLVKRGGKSYPKSGCCNNVCRIKNTRRLNEEAEETKKMLDKANKRHNRKCRRCGKPCWPNYFWCEGCKPLLATMAEDL